MEEKFHKLLFFLFSYVTVFWLLKKKFLSDCPLWLMSQKVNVNPWGLTIYPLCAEHENLLNEILAIESPISKKSE